MYIMTPLERAWQFRELIRAVVRRELAVRFRGTILGWVWAIFGPLVMLSAYTIIFSAVVGAPGSAAGGPGAYALSIFAGLIIFNLFSELAYRSPGLLHEHADVIKRSIFPSETLAWTATIRACVYAGISFGVLLVFEIVISHSIPMTAIFLPLVLVPLFLFLLGMSWFLMALGCFTRDISYLMISVVPVLMFVTPIFYSVQDVPAHLQILIRCNLIANYVELIRDLLLYGTLPNPILYLGTVAASVLIFFFSYRFFMRYKAVLVDVI
jgi:homopolymeric O-antigen transport system permease protein